MRILPLCSDRQPLSEKYMVGFVIFVIFFAQGFLVLSDYRKKTAYFYFVVQISTPFHGKNRAIKKCKPSSSLAFVSFSREFLRPLFLSLN